MQQLPKNIIMTPHPKEFDRLAGNASSSCTERLMKASELAERLQAYIILKGHYSALCHPDGKIDFCSTGNSGMATAGSGDVLTGIITGLLARGYKQEDACRLGMHLHGLAGDLAAKDLGKREPHRQRHHPVSSESISQIGRIIIKKIRISIKVRSSRLLTFLLVSAHHRTLLPRFSSNHRDGPYSTFCGYGNAGW